MSDNETRLSNQKNDQLTLTLHNIIIPLEEIFNDLNNIFDSSTTIIDKLHTIKRSSEKTIITGEISNILEIVKKYDDIKKYVNIESFNNHIKNIQAICLACINDNSLLNATINTLQKEIIQLQSDKIKLTETNTQLENRIIVLEGNQNILLVNQFAKDLNPIIIDYIWPDLFESTKTYCSNLVELMNEFYNKTNEDITDLKINNNSKNRLDILKKNYQQLSYDERDKIKERYNNIIEIIDLSLLSNLNNNRKNVAHISFKDSFKTIIIKLKTDEDDELIDIFNGLVSILNIPEIRTNNKLKKMEWFEANMN